MARLIKFIFGKRNEKRKSILKEFMADPDSFSYHMNVCEDEIVITIKRKESE